MLHLIIDSPKVNKISLSCEENKMLVLKLRSVVLLVGTFFTITCNVLDRTNGEYITGSMLIYWCLNV